MVVPWAINLLHFHLNKLFKNVFCIFELFGLAAVLATFQKIGRFFPNHLVILVLSSGWIRTLDLRNSSRVHHHCATAAAQPHILGCKC